MRTDGVPSPTPDNDAVFSQAMTKVSLDDEAAVPTGEPGCPVRTNVRKRSASVIARPRLTQSECGSINGTVHLHASGTTQILEERQNQFWENS
jgi:hypothetical protein